MKNIILKIKKQLIPQLALLTIPVDEYNYIKEVVEESPESDIKEINSSLPFFTHRFNVKL